jgi:glutamate formiminotransferase/formiminotetrahydrofolate cyclodeaminase
MSLVECVPNVSEGRDAARLHRFAAAIRSVDGCHLLHVDSGHSTHRSVFTFVAEPDAAVEAAFRLIAATQREIDMRTHRGAHPRIGATDVCPFIPLLDSSMEDCVGLARRLGERVAVELDLPVYLYAEAAPDPARAALTVLRRGQYEALSQTLCETPPDFGPGELRPSFGAVAIGARDFLIAYNVDLETRDVSIARAVAAKVRASGAVDAAGHRHPGQLSHVQALGWWIEEYGHAQVSMNLLQPKRTGLLTAFSTVQEEALARGVAVLGSEVVGMLPLFALEDVAREIAAGGDSLARVLAAMHELELSHFDPAERILDWALRERGLLAADVSLTAVTARG